MRGAMVESAPTEKFGCRPNKANISVPATKATRPALEGSPARRAVAICSGTATANSVRPAMMSAWAHAFW
jgi:hypothetical protein